MDDELRFHVEQSIAARVAEGIPVGEARRLAMLEFGGMEAARENGIMVGRGGLYGNVLRLSPPMNIGRGDVDEFILRLDASFS